MSGNDIYSIINRELIGGECQNLNDSIRIVDNKYKNKENTIILYMFIIGIFALLFVRDRGKPVLALHLVYATILMSIGIIVFNTIKFNKNIISNFLGLICGITGILEIAYIIVGLNIGKNSYMFILFSIYISLIVDIMPIMSVNLSINLQNKNIIIKSLVSLISIVILVATVVVLKIDVRYLKEVNLNTYNWLYFIELIVSIFIILISVLILKKINSENTREENYEKLYFNKITIIIALSRLPILLHPIIKDIYVEEIISQFIINIAMYYFYRYIIYSNIKKPYLKLNDTNEQLKNKAERLKQNNKKLLQETEKIQYMKDNLISKEVRLQSTLNNSPNSIIVLDSNKEITFFNKTFEKHFVQVENKCSVTEHFKSKIINYNIFESKIDETRECLSNIEEFIYTINHKIYLVRYTPLIIDSLLEGVLCILVDKTSITEFQNKLIVANERYESFLELIDDGIVVFENGKKIYSNEAFRNMFKNSIDDIDFIFEDKKQEKLVIDGKEIYVSVSISEYLKNGKNKTIVAIKDITDKEVSQIELKNNQESYERFIDILPDGICILDNNLDIYYANKSLLHMAEYDSMNEVCKKNIKELLVLTVEKEQEIDIVLGKVFEKNREILLIDHVLMTKLNKMIQVEIVALPFQINNENHIVCIVKDLTNKKTSEIAEKELLNILKTDKVKTEFFANMSHELKTPLNVISSSNQLLDSFYKSGKIDDYNENIKYHLELVKQNSYRLQRLINNIIDLTKMDSGYYKLNLEQHNIVMVIEDLFMKTSLYAKKKDIALVFDTDMEEINMAIDKSQVERIMLNLLSNCIKFTDVGGSIYVYIYYNYEEVNIKVKDTGVGISEEKLDFIFEAFSQADRTLSRNTEGSGIGLAIVKKLVELHHGNIEVKSKVNKGTEFTISLPIKRINNQYSEIDRSIYNIDEKINIEFSDIYY